MTWLRSLPRWAKAGAPMAVAMIILLGVGVMVALLGEAARPTDTSMGPTQGTDVNVNQEGTFGFRWRVNEEKRPAVDTHSVHLASTSW